MRLIVDPPMSRSLVDSLYELSLASFGPMAVTAAARHVLSAAEFTEEMNDIRISKYVVVTEDDRPIGLATITADTAAVPWISGDYFRHRFPDHATRGALFYLGLIAVHPVHRRGSVLFELIRALVEPVLAVGGIIAYDVCATNRASAFPTAAARLLADRAVVTTSTLDAQTYYATEFRPTA